MLAGDKANSVGEADVGEYLILIEFAGSSYAEANLLAAELEEVINREMAAVRVPARAEIRRTKPEAQDFGTTVALILSSGAVIELAKALHAWLRRSDRSRVVLKTETGELLATGLESRDVPAIVAALSEKGVKKKQ